MKTASRPTIQGFAVSDAGAVIFLDPPSDMKAAGRTAIGMTITWAEL